MNIYDAFSKIVIENKEDTALVHNGKSISYKELDEFCSIYSQLLLRNEVKSGDCVAIYLENSPEFLYAYLGILKIGATAVPINPVLTETELKYVLQNCSAKAMFLSEKQKVKLDNLTDTFSPFPLLLFVENINTLTFKKELFNNSIDREVNDIAVIIYTSGTTGKPKGAMLTHENLYSNAMSFTQVSQTTKQDRIVAVLPMFHLFCLTVSVNLSLLNGATLLIQSTFNPSELVQLIREEKATLLAAVPTIYNYLYHLEHGTSKDFSTVRTFISGGSSMSVDLLKNLQEKYGVTILEGYGLTETAPVISFNPYKGICKPGSVGLDIPNVSTKIVDELGNELAALEVGEVVVSGPNVMKGYLNNKIETDKAIKNGWFYTGDIGRKDEDGYLFLLDRKKDVILMNGYSVYPREIEEVLYAHPKIKEAAVIGIKNERTGEAVKAFIVLNDSNVTEEEVFTHCKKHLAKYKQPSKIQFLEEIPKNSTGKIMKRLLEK
jgi:long-chain acyl-CoA synthetase